MMKSKVCALALILMMVLSLCGCSPALSAGGSDPANPDPALPAPADPPATGAEGASAPFPVTVTDAAGRTVTIEKAPQTLVSGYYITTSMLVALGQASKLVGIEAKAETRPIYSLAAPELLALPSVGTAKEFDLEGCAALSPELIILPLSLKDSVPALEALGLTVLTVKPEDLARLKETIALLGAATGASDAAEALLSRTEETERFLTETLADAKKPSVYLAGNSGYLSTAGAKMYQHTLIEMGGGVNVAASLEDDYWAEISYEQLLSWDPEVIVIAPGAKYTKEDLLTDTQLSALSAVQSGSIFAMPKGLEAWDSPVPSAAVGSRWMASTLHPALYPFDAFAGDAAAFYRDFYHFALDAALLAQ